MAYISFGLFHSSVHAVCLVKFYRMCTANVTVKIVFLYNVEDGSWNSPGLAESLLWIYQRFWSALHPSNISNGGMRPPVDGHHLLIGDGSSQFCFLQLRIPLFRLNVKKGPASQTNAYSRPGAALTSSTAYRTILLMGKWFSIVGQCATKYAKPMNISETVSYNLKNLKSLGC